MAREFVERDGYRGRDVPGRVFLLGPHIDNRDMPGPDPFKQLGSRYPFSAGSEVGAGGGLNVWQVGAGHRPRQRE